MRTAKKRSAFLTSFAAGTRRSKANVDLLETEARRRAMAQRSAIHAFRTGGQTTAGRRGCRPRVPETATELSSAHTSRNINSCFRRNAPRILGGAFGEG